MRFEHHKGRFSKLEALGGNRFLSTWNDPLYGVKVLPFTVENGKVKSLTVRVADFVEFTPYEFIKINKCHWLLYDQEIILSSFGVFLLKHSVVVFTGIWFCQTPVCKTLQLSHH